MGDPVHVSVDATSEGPVFGTVVSVKCNECGTTAYAGGPERGAVVWAHAPDCKAGAILLAALERWRDAPDVEHVR